MTRTEAAIQALVATLLAQSQVVDAAIPAPLRNADLPGAMAATEGSDLKRYLNVWDGAGEVTDEMLGADLGVVIDDTAEGNYDITHRSIVEWVVADGADTEREAAFDAGLRAIHDAVRPVVSGDGRTYLGGAVSFATIEGIARQGSGLVTDGLPSIKACEITVRLNFTSQRPF